MTDAEFRELHDAHARRLWAYVYRATGEANTAEDIAQEAFFRVLTAPRLNSATAEHRRRYLYKVATNLIRRRSRPPAELAVDARTAQPEDRADERLDVERALSRLSEIERQSLWLSYVEGWSHREIARMLGYREGSLRQVIVRARRRFIEAFGEASTSDEEQK